ncbi:MAG: PLDc N-terminal domain-containing protein [Acidimicrobiia bacterium]
MVNFAAWAPIFIVFALFSIAMLIHLFTHDVPYMPKWGWALLIVLTMPLGGMIYLIVVIIGAGLKPPDVEGRTPQP